MVNSQKTVSQRRKLRGQHPKTLPMKKLFELNNKKSVEEKHNRWKPPVVI